MSAEEGEEEDARKSSACGLLVLYNSVFHRSGRRNERQPSTPTSSSSAGSPKLTLSNSKRRRPGSDEASLLASSAVASHASLPHHHKPDAVPAPAYHKAAAMQKEAGRNGGARATTRCGSIVAAELDSMIHDHQRTRGSGALVRASLGNVMLFGNLGNIRAPGAVTASRNVLDNLPKTAKEASDGKQQDSEAEAAAAAAAPAEVLCRALSRRLDPEELKEMGNEEYKNGRFAEAVALYDRAILIDPGKAPYWSNKAAALMGMGRLLEAVAECKEAVRIDPAYGRAHLRLGTLYLRLGEAEKAIHHYKLAKGDASSRDVTQAQALQMHLFKCDDARKRKDWHGLLQESQSAVSAGADSSPQIFAYQEEALLALRRQEEAEATLRNAPKFDVDASTKFFGGPSNAYFLAVRAQVDMAAGRFEEALNISQRAARIDPGSREVSAVARKARLAAQARSKGNDLFKASKYWEACIAYEEGLGHDPHNAILLCNRAAARSKLCQWEKAVDDCTVALKMRPSYTKARLRRADCNAKLERWEASIQDYEVLMHEMPGDEEVSKALSDARLQLEKQRDRSNNFITITSKDQFKQFIATSRLSVALLFNKSRDVSIQTVSLVEQLSKRYATVNFLKVDLERDPKLAECESSLPVIKFYKSGACIESISASDHDELESSLKILSK
uniref:Uncharacterized protein n=1 Tax=Ananas comosus var. bracteatus TaxID=296719 RepID=A0A6V7PGB5_ANACO|nr:unnamed protein product [Ananas comosus var. bracteatus]